MAQVDTPHRPFGRTGLSIPPIVFGTSSLGNLYRVVPEETKVDIVSEMFRSCPSPVVLDTAGKYGAGLALEAIGKSLKALRVRPEDVLISNKLGWYRVPLTGSEPQFERGVWAGIRHEAEARIDYEGILQCEAQGRELLGPGYQPALLSLHDPDEYLAAVAPAERARRFEDVLGGFKALSELKEAGRVTSIGVGAKDWRVIREIAQAVDLDWVMLACSLTVYSHPAELLEFVSELRSRGIGIINSAVFNAGFLTGGAWFDYRRPDPVKDAPLFRWRDSFFAVCRRQGASPATVCVQFALAVPGIAAVALSSENPEHISANVRSAFDEVPPRVWSALKDENLISRDFPVGC